MRAIAEKGMYRSLGKKKLVIPKKIPPAIGRAVWLVDGVGNRVVSSLSERKLNQRLSLLGRVVLPSKCGSEWRCDPA